MKRFLTILVLPIALTALATSAWAAEVQLTVTENQTVLAGAEVVIFLADFQFTATTDDLPPVVVPLPELVIPRAGMA